MKKPEKNEEELKKLKEIEKMVKPKVMSLILGTLVCLGPYGNLIFKITTKDYDDLLLTTLLVFPTLLILFWLWWDHIHKLRSYKQVARDIFEELNEEE